MFPQRLRKLRQERNLTAKQLGEKFSLAISTISGYETGVRTPDLNQIEKFADFFEVSVDYLLGRTDNPSPTKEKNITDQSHRDFHFYDTNGVQFIARSDKNLSPAAYKKMQELAKKAAELFDEEEEE